MEIINIILTKPLLELFLFLQKIFGDAGIATIFFSFIVRIPLTPLYLVLYKEEEKLKKIQGKIREKVKGEKDFLKQAEIISDVYKQENFNPFKNIFLQFLPIPILLALIGVFQKIAKTTQKLFFLNFIDLTKPNLILAVFVVFFQFIYIKTQTEENKKIAYLILGIIAIVVFTVPAIFSLYWGVIMAWTIIERNIYLRLLKIKN